MPQLADPHKERAKRATINGYLTWGESVVLPISIFKLEQEYELDTHLFHEGCGHKIIQPRQCEIHPEPDPIVFSAILVNENEIIPVSAEQRRQLLGTNSDIIQIVSSHPIRSIIPLLIEGQITEGTIYEISPQHGKKGYDVRTSGILSTLFSRLIAKNRVLLCKCPLNGMERYALITGNGRLITLRYDEELRNQIGCPEGEIIPSLGRQIDKLLVTIDAPFPQKISLKLIANRVKKFVANGSTVSTNNANSNVVSLEQLLQDSLTVTNKTRRAASPKKIVAKKATARVRTSK